MLYTGAEKEVPALWQVFVDNMCGDSPEMLAFLHAEVIRDETISDIAKEWLKSVQ